MAKGYWIARIDVGDAEGYKDYVAAARPAFERFGARFLARGGEAYGAEGPARGRNVVIEFESLAQARACFESAEYQAARAIRQRHAEGEIVLVEGV
jgi:uncharacterized protein (DUF1330 family)